MLNQLNIQIFNAINQFAGSNVLLDGFMIIIAKYLPFFFILFLLYLWLKKNKKDIVLFSVYSAVFGILLNFLITLFYFHPRPFMEHMGNTLINHVAETSFPSDHTTFMLSIAIMLLYFKETRNAGIILFFLGLFGGIARVFCGVHYPFDIFGSIIVAVVSSYILFLFKSKFQRINAFLLEKYQHFLISHKK